MESTSLAAHLQDRYGIDIAGVSEIESVHRVDRRDGPSWIARVFPEARPIECVEGDAEILGYLEAQGFPAERCAHPAPVSSFEGHGVLVTELVDGPNGRPDQRAETLRTMGDLLGRLQTLPITDGATARPAGAWHHLSPAGGGRGEDVSALDDLLVDAKHAPLREELDRIDLLEGLPRALLHPDFVTANVMLSPDGPVLIDWTGAGQGPRVVALGMLLSTAADLGLVDTIVAAYRTHVELEADELSRLSGAVRAFGLIIDCWTGVHHPALLAHVVRNLPGNRERAEAIAARAHRAFAAG